VKRLIVTAVAGVAMAFSAVSAPAAAAAPATITWGPCQDPSLVAAGAQCGMLQVPMDYRRPAGKQLRIAVSRIRHKTPESAFQGVMLTVSGGPGLPGLTLATLGTLVPGQVGDAYDWIGFDPRGIGTSSPALSCDPGYMDFDRPNYVPVTPQLERTWLNRVRNYAAACGAHNDPDLLANMKTTDAVADLERIRAALGVTEMSFYGYSYGTYVEEVYATLHPDRVRRMVLDSTVHPRDVYYRLNLSQDAGYDRSLNAFFGWVASHDDVYHLGRTQAAVKNVYDRQLVKLAREPAAGAVGPDEWTDVFQLAAYRQLHWTLVADAFAGWVNQHDGATLKTLFVQIGGRGNDNAYAAYLAVECTDTQSPTNWHKWRADTWRAFAEAPYFAWQNTWINAPCAFWPTPAGKPVNVGSHRLDSMLLVDETLDPATPFEGSLETRARFPAAALLAVPGGLNHANTLMGGNACVDGKIAEYLSGGPLPARKSGKQSDLECPPLPLPVPPAGQ
jgi:pimeloyl-ACP methyl ester carboxylesterase